MLLFLDKNITALFVNYRLYLAINIVSFESDEFVSEHIFQICGRLVETLAAFLYKWVVLVTEGIDN